MTNEVVQIKLCCCNIYHLLWYAQILTTLFISCVRVYSKHNEHSCVYICTSHPCVTKLYSHAGAQPYGGTDITAIPGRVLAGHRLECPEGCPEQMYAVTFHHTSTRYYFGTMLIWPTHMLLWPAVHVPLLQLLFDDRLLEWWQRR